MESRSRRSPGTEPPEISNGTNISRIERLASLVGGGALTVLSLRRPSMPRIVLAATGSLLATRGLTGHSRVYEALGVDMTRPGTKAKTVRLEETITIYRPSDEVYAFWRELTNLPRFMPHLERVEDLGDGRSRWTARIPKGLGTISWEAEITEDEPNTLLAWQSVPGADIQNAGRVRFEELSGRRTGTEVFVEISYSPPPGEVGPLVAGLLKPLDEKLVREDLRRFKQLVETGEVPTVEGQPACR